MLEVIKGAVGDKIPLIAGTGAVSTAEAVALSHAADKLGYELLMVLSAYYTKPSQVELTQHFKTVAASIKTNMILYNIPIFTGVNLEPATVAELAKIDNVVGIKEEAELHPKQMTDYMNCTSEDFVVYCGDDVMILEAFAQGGAKRAGGVVSGGAHLIGDKLREMIETFLDGNIQEAADMQRKFLPLFRSMGAGGRTNPVCLLKGAMKLMGYNSGVPRLPLLPGTEQELAVAVKIMKELGIIS
jgi:4-hydroxy-tetrahydrodipicolinate synthase